ncbi:hypothetical protein WA026_006812 [Henosepilachna vigintioctopunctata]|uniref:Peptidase metallopeptidase domain-containing protein n=1 Tax=Henosepilachna vigintioctopunctata TaxID=420089 RepID=A0AAW1UK33_9CUCU
MSIFWILYFLSLYVKNSYSTSSKYNKALIYLSNYGYLDANDMKMDSSNKKPLKKGIKQFQSFMGLKPTGFLSRDTMKTMSMPRCGVKDKTGPVIKRFQKYSAGAGRWNMMLLRYKIVKYPEAMKKWDVDNTFEQAFNKWSEHSNIMFEAATYGKIDIEIKFVKGQHGDETPFTGPGNVVAHAFFPTSGGDIHFDDYETWTINSPKGTNLLQVAMHEIGHSLGLTHSDEFEAVMCPITKRYTPGYGLHQDDIRAIQDLYGKKNKSMPAPTPSPYPPETDWENWWYQIPYSRAYYWSYY